MADFLIADAAGEKVKLWMEAYPAGGPWHDVTHIRCENTASRDATFTLTFAANGNVLGQMTFPNTGTTRVALDHPPRVRLDTDGRPDLSAYILSYSGPVW